MSAPPAPEQRQAATHRGRIVDLTERRVFAGIVEVVDGRIAAVREDGAVAERSFLCPGFVDAHVHIESSLLSPPEFARIAAIHGTVATVSDPHEIANVLGVEGVRHMQRLAAGSACKIHLGIPSCVPATGFETAGAAIGADEVAELCADPSLLFLAEVMNVPGVIGRDPEVVRKLEIAARHGKRIDGHAPGLRGAGLAAYVAAGIETDHECSQLDEAQEKVALGQKILIREGSAARNFEDLWPLLAERPERCMLCSDDKHADDLLEGHIDRLCARAVARGVDVFDVLRAACRNPVEHYGLHSGLLRPGDPADFIRLRDLESFEVEQTWIDGTCVAHAGKSLVAPSGSLRLDVCRATPKSAEDFAVPAGVGRIRVIEVADGQIITRAGEADAMLRQGFAVADPARDLLKVAVVNRYEDRPPAVAFVRGFGLRQGAIASSVAHDSHNFVAVGASDEELARAVNLLVACRGGLAAVGGTLEKVLALPVAGLMSDASAEEVAGAHADLTRAARELGSTLCAPFMALSFLALLVIPALKLSDRGLFDATAFAFVPLFTGDQPQVP
ncbi:MAG TPA: adenine deaminase [Thermoanaerobaculaceae bacterium]|nr:adenine deaminase [Thermoanaerobaculaceae bacterium]HRS15315.1 adenine deaminase [Thermoanaerobaculaceae bacterium]